MAFRVPEERRVLHGQLGSTADIGNNGAFILLYAQRRKPYEIFCIASDGEGWEHVSVSVKNHRCPYWDEMVFVRHVFWEPEDIVVQLHPPESEYVNCHPFTLHLWRKANSDDFVERPPVWMVGPLQ